MSKNSLISDETLNLVLDSAVNIAIVNTIHKAGLQLIGINPEFRRCVTVKDVCLPIEISWEMCSCHGGRMWFNQDNTNIHIELSSGEYDTEKGITDPATELAYYIDNEMVKIIKDFSKYVYIVDTIGEYTDDKHERRYYKSIEDASYDIFKEDGHDAFSEFGTVIHQFPNPDMRYVVSYAKTNDKNQIEFNCLHENRKRGETEFTADREFKKIFHVFCK